MSEVAITQEQMFRVVYAEELKKKRDNELQDERRRVNYQEGKTPGRRGEIIMQDEISKETIRRYYLNQKKARSPIRIYASIYASREKQALSDVNDYSLCNWKTLLFCYFVAQALSRYLLALLLRIALTQQMIDAAVYA